MARTTITDIAYQGRDLSTTRGSTRAAVHDDIRNEFLDGRYTITSSAKICQYGNTLWTKVDELSYLSSPVTHVNDETIDVICFITGGCREGEGTIK